MTSPARYGVQHSDFSNNPYEPRTSASEPEPRRHSFTTKLLGRDVSASPARRANLGHLAHNQLPEDSLTAQMHRFDAKDQDLNADSKRSQPVQSPAKGKLGTFAGVFVPTSLNVFSVLMFLRFGFIIGQGGILGTMGMLLASYLINLITVLSLSAVATNGTVRGGGAYYLISRSLGPEFGGSIGVVFYLANVFNTGMNAVGLVDCIKQNFGAEEGNWGSWLMEGYWWQYLWATVVLVICTLICCGGSSLFARAGNGLLFVLLLSTLSIPVSAIIQAPFQAPKLGVHYTGLSWTTFRRNFLPRLTKGAAGSKTRGRESFQDLFGILYPSTSGIFAGASMSGSLKHPSKAIPKGTLYGMALTFVSYTLVILSMGATVARETFYKDLSVVQDTAASGVLILAGEIATSLFSTLMGVVGAADLLQAIAKDGLLPGTGVLATVIGSQDIPIYSILVTYLLTQITLFGDINQIAVLVTMGFLMTFLVMNLACFLLKIGSAPNFRPSFRYFNGFTAFFGTLICGASMFFVDGWAASGCVALLIVIFLVIHYTTPPKSWGDVSQSLIYHQVRKYLLRLKTEHVKFWRPQVLLFVNDPRRSYKLIQFCNSLKKGGLFVLGHVIVTPDFELNVAEARKQQQKWTKYIDFSRIKAFVQIVISPSAEWGTRNLVLSAGLGGMRPNIVVMGFYNLPLFHKTKPLVDVGQSEPTPENDDNDADLPAGQELPTDDNRQEPDVSPGTYVTMLEDLLLGIQINVAVARNFSALQLPRSKDLKGKKYIDLWPIQMSAEIAAPGLESAKNVLTTNFDTYTLILQLGCILNTVPAWKKAYQLRVIVFVEYESEVEEERSRVQSLLDNLRIRATVVVLWLASGDCKTYQAIVNGDYSDSDPNIEAEIEKDLEDEDWWQEIQQLRGKRAQPPSADLAELISRAGTPPARSMASGRDSQTGSNVERYEGLRRVLQRAEHRMSVYQLSNRRSSVSLRTTAPVMSITTQRLPADIINQHAIQDSASEDEDSDEDFPSTAEETEVETDDALTSNSTSIRARRTSAPAADDLNSWQAQFSGIHRGTSNDVESISPGQELGAAAEDEPTKLYPSQSDTSVPQLKDLVEVEQRVADAEASSVYKGKSVSSDGPHGSSELQSPTPQITKSSPSMGKDETTLSSTLSSRPDTAESSPTKPRRPKPSRHQSGIKFSSKPVPATRVATEDGPGPSIMFTESAERADAPRPNRRSIYDRSAVGAAAAMADDAQSILSSAQLSAQSVPLSFNDLPCRAQHLILNELMRANSGRQTAVLFTTLPSPALGTGKNEDDSVAYLSDLDLLCRRLPPTLLVHSNSMTVTMNL